MTPEERIKVIREIIEDMQADNQLNDPLLSTYAGALEYDLSLLADRFKELTQQNKKPNQ